MILSELNDEVRNLSTEVGWRNSVTPWDGPPWFAALVGQAGKELGEAINAYRGGKWSKTEEDGKPSGVGPQLAETLIRILDICDTWNVDIEQEIVRVIEYRWKAARR